MSAKTQQSNQPKTPIKDMTFASVRLGDFLIALTHPKRMRMDYEDYGGKNFDGLDWLSLALAFLQTMLVGYIMTEIAPDISLKMLGSLLGTFIALYHAWRSYFLLRRVNSLKDDDQDEDDDDQNP